MRPLTASSDAAIASASAIGFGGLDEFEAYRCPTPDPPSSQPSPSSVFLTFRVAIVVAMLPPYVVCSSGVRLVVVSRACGYAHTLYLRSIRL